MKSLRIAFSSLALLALVGCSKEPKAPAPSGTPAAATAKCPTCGKPVAANVAQVDYAGHKVGFCCEVCAKSWAGMSEADKKAAYDKNMK